MNITESFTDYIETEGYATKGTSLFIGSAEKNATDNIYWVVGDGGTPVQKLSTGEMIKRYVVNLFYRNTNAQTVTNNLQTIEDNINYDTDFNLTGYEVLELVTRNFYTDQFIDNEGRSVGFISIDIETYYNGPLEEAGNNIIFMDGNNEIWLDGNNAIFQ